MPQLRNQAFLWTALTSMTVSLFCLPAQAKYSGGTGEPNDPYQIATAADLIALGETPADYDKHFILTADIDLDPNLPGRKVFDKAVIASSPGLMSSFRGTTFSGEFDGNCHTISHLTINGEGYLGLFGALAAQASVRNLGVLCANIKGSWYTIGGLAGENGGSITQCYSTGSVTGGYGVGGIVGANPYGNVIFCFSSGSMRGEDYVGGLIGSNWCGFVGHCFSTAAVGSKRDAAKEVGGLIGWGSLGHVTASFWDIQTSGQTSSAGGTGKTTAEMYYIETYLMAGWDFVDEIKNGTSQVWQMAKQDSYPLLAAFGQHAVPRLRGLGTPESPYLISDALELGMMIYHSRDACYCLTASIDLSGTYLQMPIVPVFTGTFDGNNLTISHLTIAGDYYVGLFGQLDTSSVVKDLGLLDANISGSAPNIGALTGNNGSMSQETKGGNIVHCYSTGKVYSDTASYAGGLVGQNHGGSLTSCHSSVDVAGPLCIGGLVGRNSEGDVTQCYSTGTVSAIYTTLSDVGGLVGDNWGSVTECYSTGSIDGHTYYGGGIAGVNGGPLSHCYSTVTKHDSLSHVEGLAGFSYQGFVTDSFWDTQASGIATSRTGVGKTTVEMQMASTFLDAGWDFVGETVNGTEDIWWIDEGKDYPRLWWEAHD